ncbi:PadR family transcriptional regulator [Nocardia cyriacigeorgica]|uniref:PadR family transcriptional regulator n=1 Tax=Nocardia cyriacigeorgica TaxID=135487 RepID=A0A6P1CZ23_9NOCA|nr:PadR family transcriptional regulator [Nocardia cyriacigeorgica]NEW39208.1 PadR family transcriptional regulator [Nocardia cyriacigeorgica]NEW43138.1 PadR family transcriptional regulator [Nocardia cyriacigeorgica]NEW49712.1 PadR family transcriptional regulator [Nocardia cyriacigeorgica]NEW56007.1 PadR family transcriptional regulator [Nocardia cyriacigeorgica]
MALRNAVLAALLEGESSGYDLAKGFDASVANFWMATPQQLYKELERMADEGLVETRVVQQERRPNKRLHAITPAGRAALHEFIAAPAKPTAIRDEMMVKVQGMDAADAPVVRSAVADKLEWSKAKLARYERLRSRLLNGRSEQAYLAEAERIGPYLTLLRGISLEQENIRWAEFAVSVIDRRITAQV